MSWHQVKIPENDVEDYSGKALMKKFGKACGDSRSSASSDVSVHHRKAGGHVYYFSPAASNLAPEVLREFNATVCSEEPDLSDYVKIRI